MKIAIIGTGYVGLVTGACLSNVGHQVTCVDNDKEKIEKLWRGECPIVEKDLSDRIKKGIELDNLNFSLDIEKAIQEHELIFIAVGTPSEKGGNRADLSAVYGVVDTIRLYAENPKIIIQKSTVPVGTGDELERSLNTPSSCGGHIVVSNPEFLKEGNAVADFEKPDRIIIGTDNQKAKKLMIQVYSPFARRENKLVFMSRPSAELSKVFANAMLAMRISAMNAITELAEKTGADVTEIRRGVGMDSRIGPAFLYPGGATFGGSCFPKDVRALIAIMNKFGISAGIFEEVMKINYDQRQRFLKKIVNFFNGNLEGRRIAVWGLAFKPGTDDVREAASLDVVECLLENKALPVLFDEHARASFDRALNESAREKVIYANNQYDALKEADALIILTDTKSFGAVSLERFQAEGINVIFDGKNLYSPCEMAEARIHYVCMGRPRIS